MKINSVTIKRLIFLFLAVIASKAANGKHILNWLCCTK